MIGVKVLSPREAVSYRIEREEEGCSVVTSFTQCGKEAVGRGEGRLESAVFGPTLPTPEREGSFQTRHKRCATGGTEAISGPAGTLNLNEFEYAGGG